MGSSFLPVDQSWERFIADADAKYDELKGAVSDRLRELAEQARQRINEPSVDGKYPYEEDPWLRQLDWSPKRPKKGVIQALQADNKEPEVVTTEPKWYSELSRGDEGEPVIPLTGRLAPLLLRTTWDGHPLTWSDKLGWSYLEDGQTMALRKNKVSKILGAAAFRKSDELQSPHADVRPEKATDEWKDEMTKTLSRLAIEAVALSPTDREQDPHLKQLDWTPVARFHTAESESDEAIWPKWYHELWKKPTGQAPELHLTVRSRVAPLLFRCRWRGHPLVHTREHGWTFKVDRDKVETAEAQAAEQVLNTEESAARLNPNADQLTLEKTMPLQSLEPGRYQVTIKVNDGVSKQTLAESAPFIVEQ